MPADAVTQPAAAASRGIVEGQPLVIRPNGPDERYFPAIVFRKHGEGYFIRFVNQAPALDSKSVQVMYRDQQQAFVSCEGRMALIEAQGERHLGCLVLTSGPAAAEQRSNFRIALSVQALEGVIGRGMRCRIADISAGGMGVLVADPLVVDGVVDVRFELEGQKVGGRARVCSQRRQGDGQYRCGLQALPEEVELRGQLREAAMSLQRQQLRRMSRQSA